MPGDAQPKALNAPKKLLLANVVVAAACGPMFAGIVSARQLVAPQAAFAFSLIAPPGAMSATARGINNVGYIVGSFADGTGTHGFLYRNGAFTTLDVPGSAWAMATGINNAGQIVGVSGDGGAATAYVLTGSTYSRIPTETNTFVVARGVNNLGDIVGQDGGPLAPYRGFLRTGGTYSPLPAPGNAFSWNVHGVNDLGQLVGEFTDESGRTFGYLATPSVFTAPPAAADPFAPPAVAVLDHEPTRVASTAPAAQGPPGPEGSPGPPGPPGAAGRARGARGGLRGLNAVRNALGRSRNSLGRGGPDNPFAQRAIAAVELAIADADAAIAFVEANRPAEGRSGIRAAVARARPVPGRQDIAEQPQGCLRTSGRSAGGDLGGSRARMYEAIATASRETIADIVVTAREDDLRRIVRSLQRIANLIRTSSAGSDHARRAAVAIQSAIDASQGAIQFIHIYPDAATGEPPATDSTIEAAGSPPAAGAGQYPGREAALRELGEAYSRVASLPGWRLWGLRLRIQTAIGAAYAETLADLNAAAERERQREKPPEPSIDGLRFQ